MAEVLTKIEVNCLTGEQSIVPLTEEEIAQREVDAVAFAAAEAELIKTWKPAFQAWAQLVKEQQAKAL